MKTFLLLASLILVSVTAQYGQPGAPKRTAEERATSFVENLGKELTLTQDQSAKVMAIQLESIKKIDEIREKGMAGDDKKAMRQQIMDANGAADTQIKALLTDDQKSKFDAWQVKRQEEMKNRQPKPGGNN
ncbi:MAG: hypothetical protein IPL55_17650 [Saprospiraceae bacterium]|jgi:Spy/CpxP family protein refolding chaperone|nr:hypothetical protein [Saprospiraceae bacterium]MBL0023877.1 hypothetical protein [Saprospiraceae bacterium]